jgi:diacylglycerol kinase (ATP)
MEKVYFIVNPNAKNGSCREIWRNIEKELDVLGTSYLAFFTQYPGHAKEIALSISRKANGSPIAIAAVGGDGTLHEVINGTAGYNYVTVGFIPGGSGNDFSRGFHIPQETRAALHLFLGNTRRSFTEVDLGKITHNQLQETYFMNNMGVGFDAVISKEANESGMKRLFNRLSMGRLVYAYILIKKLITFQCIPIELWIDGEKYKFEKVWFVTVSNQPYFGGGMKIAPQARTADGLLDVTVVHQLARWKLLLVFISVFWGKHTRFKEVQQFTGKSICIASADEVLIHADGEVIGYTPVKIQVCPKFLTVFSENGIEGHTEELKIDDCH